MAGGRPTTYTDEIAELVCERVATHAMSISKIFKHYEYCDKMPAMSTVYLWMYKNKQFSEKYLDALKTHAHLIAAETIDLIDELKDLEYDDVEKGATRIDSGIVAAYRQRVNQRNIMCMKWNPEYYANKDKVETENTKDSQKIVQDAIELIMKSKERDY